MTFIHSEFSFSAQMVQLNLQSVSIRLSMHYLFSYFQVGPVALNLTLRLSLNLVFVYMAYIIKSFLFQNFIG